MTTVELVEVLRATVNLLEPIRKDRKVNFLTHCASRDFQLIDGWPGLILIHNAHILASECQSEV